MEAYVKQNRTQDVLAKLLSAAVITGVFFVCKKVSIQPLNCVCMSV